MRAFAIPVLTAVLLASCAADTSLPPDEYAEQATDAAAMYVAEAQALSLRYQGDVERKVAELAATESPTAVEDATSFMGEETVRYLAELDDTIGRFVEALLALEPPSDLAEVHDRYVEVIETVRSNLPILRSAVSDATSIDEIGKAIAGSGLADGQAVWVAACSGLEQSIRDSGHGADLKCTKSDVTP